MGKNHSDRETKMIDSMSVIHPFTGLAAAGFRRNGDPIWPIMGGSESGSEGDGGDSPEEAARKAADKKAAEAAEDPAKTAADIKAVADSLGITVGQLKGRLEASKEWEKRAKQVTPEELKTLRETADEFTKLKDANKSETQTLLDRIEAAEKKAASVETELSATKVESLRNKIAAEKKVPANLLTAGTTQEEIEAIADSLLEFKGTKPLIPDLGQGRREGTEVDPGQGLARLRVAYEDNSKSKK